MLLGLVPLPDLHHYYVDRRLLTGVQQIVQHFPCHFLPGRIEYLRTVGEVVLGFPLCFIGFQLELSSLLRLETYFLKDSFRISWSLDLSLLLVQLNILLLSGVRVLCQVDLPFLFPATSLLIS